jgi:hypothetical protein
MRTIVMVTIVLATTLASAKAGDSKRWVTHRDSSGIFSVQFPAAPTVKVKPNSKFFGKPSHETWLSYDTPNQGYLVQVYKLDNRWMIQGKERGFLDSTVSGWTKPDKGKIAGPTRFAWQGSPGVYIRTKTKKMDCLMYFVLRERHYFQVIVAGKPGAIDMKAAQRFVNSFKFL